MAVPCASAGRAGTPVRRTTVAGVATGICVAHPALASSNITALSHWMEGMSRSLVPYDVMAKMTDR
jgi:hypothetical protein